MKKVFLSVLLVMSMLICCGCTTIIREKRTAANESLPQPDPYDGLMYDAPASLYYSFRKTYKLVSKQTDMKFSSDELGEVTLLRNLISANEANDDFTSFIPQKTQIVQLFVAGNVTYITLSADFLDSSNYQSDYFKSLATWQIVNTIAAYNGTSVQILVDIDNDEVGNRIKYSDLGFNDREMEKYDYAAPFQFSNDIMFLPEDLPAYVFDCIDSNDFQEASEMFLAGGRVKTVADDVKKCMNGKKIISYETLAAAPAGITLGDHDVYVSLQIKNDNGETYNKNGVLSLKENGSFYKLNLAQFNELLEIGE